MKDECELGAGCSMHAHYKVTRKAAGSRPASSVMACFMCASRIGAVSFEGPVIDLPFRESRYYKIEHVGEVAA